MGDPQKRPVGVRTYEGGGNWEDYRTEFMRFARVVPRKGDYSLWDVISGVEERPEEIEEERGNADVVAARWEEIRDWEDKTPSASTTSRAPSPRRRGT